MEGYALSGGSNGVDPEEFGAEEVNSRLLHIKVFVDYGLCHF